MLGRARKPKELGARPPTPEELAEAELERVQATRTKRDLRAVIKGLHDRIEVLESRQEWITLLEERPPPKPAKVKKLRGQGKSKPAAHFAACASDLHFEETVEARYVNGLNEYSLDISAERWANYTKSVLTVLALNRGAWDIRNMTQWFGGDIITGHLHLENVQENSLPPGEAIVLAFDRLRDHLLALLSADLETIDVVCNYGNHGRMTQKPQQGMGTNNLEWVLYCMLDRWFSNEPRVRFQIADGYLAYTDWYGFRTRWHHGDGFNYGGGVGGLTVPFYRWSGARARGGDQVDLDVVGHWHTLQRPNGLVGNGSLIGITPWAYTKGFAPEPPAQAAFVVDEHHRQNFWQLDVLR